jgi:hypothetical protein
MVIANVVHSSMILVSLMIDLIYSSEESDLTTATRRQIPEDEMLHSHCHENLKSYIAFSIAEK